MSRVALRESLSVKAPRPPAPSSEAVSRSMQGNKAVGTKPELLLRKAVRAAGLKGVRYNPKDLPGKPDLYFRVEKLAVFLNGCFWHRCPFCAAPMPKKHRSYWIKKFEANQERDLRKRRRLWGLGIKVLTIWECRLQKDPAAAVQRISVKLGR